VEARATFYVEVSEKKMGTVFCDGADRISFVRNRRDLVMGREQSIDVSTHVVVIDQKCHVPQPRTIGEMFPVCARTRIVQSRLDRHGIQAQLDGAIPRVSEQVFGDTNRT
jgi:hypothetical protein